uniref:Uncharacterized protein n=1 Tax=viral metagenome TaxID=1070528 RepID=A0A6C0JPW0_9ZZZZ
MAVSNINFVLSALEQDFSSLLATIEQATPGTLLVDATAVQNVTRSRVRSTFKFQTDSDDLNDLSGADVKYYVRSSTDLGLDASSTYMGLDASWNPMSDTVVQTGMVATTGSNGASLNDMSPSADYLRHLADVLFGTHFGVDLFTNETAIIDNIIAESQGEVQGHFIAAASMTNADNTSINLTRELIKQIFDTYPQRFQDVSATYLEQSVPIETGDSISFRIIVRADGDQALVTGITNIRDAVLDVNISPPLTKLDRVYGIKFLVVADS